MKETKFRTHFSYENHCKKGESSLKPSKTIPNEAMSIPEMIRRYASGLPLGGSKIPMYESEEEDLLNGTNWNKLDLSEKMDFMKNLKHELNDINQRIQNPPQQNVDKTTTTEGQ